MPFGRGGFGGGRGLGAWQPLSLLPQLPLAAKMVVGNALRRPVWGNYPLHGIWLPILWRLCASLWHRIYALWISSISHHRSSAYPNTAKVGRSSS